MREHYDYTGFKNTDDILKVPGKYILLALASGKAVLHRFQIDLVQISKDQSLDLSFNLTLIRISSKTKIGN
jgi:hypothetical protein